MGVHYIAVECVNCLCSILIYYVVTNIYSHSQFIKSSRMCNICSAFSILKTWDGKLSIYQATINVRTDIPTRRKYIKYVKWAATIFIVELFIVPTSLLVFHCWHFHCCIFIVKFSLSEFSLSNFHCCHFHCQLFIVKFSLLNFHCWIFIVEFSLSNFHCWHFSLSNFHCWIFFHCRVLHCYLTNDDKSF